MVYERVVDIIDKLFQRISDATRRVNNAAVVRTVTCSVVRKPGRAFKLAADILNYCFKLRRVHSAGLFYLFADDYFSQNESFKSSYISNSRSSKAV
jgi:hypothetical protein